MDLSFGTEVDGILCTCHVTYYYPGTNFPINSASLEPNDPEEFDYSLEDSEGEDLDHDPSDRAADTLFKEFKRLIPYDDDY